MHRAAHVLMARPGAKKGTVKMKIVHYKAAPGLWLNWFRHDGRLFVCLQLAVWVFVFFEPRTGSKEMQS